MGTRAVEQMTEHDIMQMTPPQFAQFVSLEECEGCAFADVCDGCTCLDDLMGKEQDRCDEQQQAWRPF